MKKILFTLTFMSMLLSTTIFASEGAVEINPVNIEYTEAVTTSVPVIMDYNPTLYAVDFQVIINDNTLTYDVAPQKINDVTMLPLRYTLEALGYEVTYNSQNMSIEIKKGAQYTSITLGENAYYKNRMAPMKLSAAPVAISGRTMVPLEFFWVILDQSFTIDSNDVIFDDDMMAIHSGYVSEITRDETGVVTYVIVDDLQETGMEYQTIIHTNQFFTYTQKTVNEGDFITALCPPVMTMSIPAQTSGYVIY